MSKNRIGKKNLFIMLVLAIITITGFKINPVLGDVPTVENIEPWAIGTETILNITIRHSNPTTSHYVNNVQVDIDGAVQNVGLPSTPIQSAPTFVMQFNMGELTTTPTVEAKANCNLHGAPLSWSDPVVVPEFSPVYLLLVVAIVSIAIFLLRSKISRSKEK